MTKYCPRCKRTKETIEFYKNKTQVDGFQTHCKQCFEKVIKISRRKDWRKYLDMKNRYAKKVRKPRIRALKEKLYQQYGEKCACCGLEDIRFLTIDHINNDGYKDRKRAKNKLWFYTQVIKERLSNKYQILCWNCNCAKAVYKVCPHKM